MDQFLLSASSNQLFVHQIGLPSQQKSQTLNSSKFSSMDEFWFKYAHQVKLENCKNITAICAPNQVGPTRILLRLEFQVAHPILNVTLATDRSKIHIAYTPKSADKKWTQF